MVWGLIIDIYYWRKIVHIKYQLFLCNILKSFIQWFWFVLFVSAFSLIPVNMSWLEEVHESMPVTLFHYNANHLKFYFALILHFDHYKILHMP